MKAIGPGSLVRCVDNIDVRNGQVLPLELGKIYSVVGVHDCDGIADAIWIAEHGTGLICHICKRESAWHISHFVPVDEGDIQIFRDLAANPKQKVRA